LTRERDVFRNSALSGTKRISPKRLR